MRQERKKEVLVQPHGYIPHTWIEGCFCQKQGSQWNSEDSIPPLMPQATNEHTSSVLPSLVQLTLTQHSPFCWQSFSAPTAVKLKTVPSTFSLRLPSLILIRNLQMLLLLVCPEPTDLYPANQWVSPLYLKTGSPILQNDLTSFVLSGGKVI